MIVLKFGGTSVGTAAQIQQLVPLINNDSPKIIVLSAMSGTTNALVEIADYIRTKALVEANNSIDQLRQKYHTVILELFNSSRYRQKGAQLLDKHFKILKDCCRLDLDEEHEKIVLAQGELLSTNLLQLHLSERKITAVVLAALDFMRLNRQGEPDLDYINHQLNQVIARYPSNQIFITQGFIARTAEGAVSNLGRGGSDYSASLIGAAIQAKEIQIWTDIDGMHNNDPRYVEGTSALAKLSFVEAAELAYFGAKILHPLSIGPAKDKDIAVRLKNTLQPQAKGTLIGKKIEGEGVKAIAAKDAITVIKIQSDRMLMAYGFMRHVFEVFERYQTPIDMVATSEVAVSISIDKPLHLPNIVKDLEEYGRVEVDHRLSIICIVGNYISDKGGIAAEIFKCLDSIPVRMISFGGSRHNISILVKEDNKQSALKALHQLFTP